MILELKIQNFLSFKNEVIFSFEATSDKLLEEYYVAEMPDETRILKMAMVYGANASGKSNLLETFEFLNFFTQHIPEEKEGGTRFAPFEFGETRKKPGTFELLFYVDGKKHRYQLVIDRDTVLEEKLFVYPGTQPAAIFIRSFDAEKKISVVQFGSKVKISSQAVEAIQLKTLKNASVFAAYNQVNLSIPELDSVVAWLRNQFLNVIDPYTDLTGFSDKTIKDNDKMKLYALKFLKEADFNITNVLFEERVRNVPEEMLKYLDVLPMTDEERSTVAKEKTLHYDETMFTHRIINDGKEESYNLSENSQSQGTLRYYGLSAPFFHAIEKNAFLPIDEIGSALHPLLVMHFLKEFLQKSNQAQLLFTTHNMSLLNEKDILRKDAIWFTEKGEDGATDLYSMADFNFRKELSFYNAYKIGKFGGIPKL
ncbi:AAA family ATPase [Maribellus comscasis]|uniref:AAA family ATPase n=1 Tax=Maribellus comscasis TaxID=2681766 RepID=A0A6I6JX84_9BACT|nr:ATP-binding protein [Maribellus comscasis]QGY47766.1 AAA family ATPase [Maribellus comscasis]